MAFIGSTDPMVSAVVGKGGIGVYVWDPVTLELSWDANLAALFHADRDDEPPFEVWQRRIHPADRDRIFEVFSRSDTTEGHYRLLLDDGSVRHLLSRITHSTTTRTGIRPRSGA